MKPNLADLATHASHVLHDYVVLTYPIMQEGTSKLLPKLRWVQNQLNLCCHVTSESALLLVSHSRLWDVEMLVRSITEGTLRLAFLSLGNATEQAERVDEYLDTLPEISSMKRHQRATAILDCASVLIDADRQPLEQMLLTEDEYNLLTQKYPKKFRQQLEHKWSFFEIAQVLAKQTSGTIHLDQATLLAYSYGMSSHQLHKDADAVTVVWDRSQRSDVRREAIDLAHAGREISDVLSMAMLRTLLILKSHDADTNELIALNKRHETLTETIHEIAAEWWNIESKHED